MTPDFAGTLLESILDRVAHVRRLETRLGQPESFDCSHSFLREVTSRTLLEVQDVEQVLRAPASGAEAQAVDVDLGGLVTRALRICEPFLRTARMHVVFETRAASAQTSTHPALALRLLALILHDACCSSSTSSVDAFSSLKLSLGGESGGRGPWFWMSKETTASAESSASVLRIDLPAEVSSLAAKLGAGLELVELPLTEATGKRALQVWFPKASAENVVRSEVSAESGARSMVSAVETIGAPGATSPMFLPGPSTSLELGLPGPELSLRRDPASTQQPPEALEKGEDPEALVTRVQTMAAEAVREFLAGDTSHHPLLVVDDEEALLAFFAALLPTVGLEFELARSFEEALGLMQPGRFSLAIVDKNLGGKSGLKLLHDMRGVDPDLGAVLMTAYASAHSISEVLHLGVYDFLEKPFPDVSVLLSRIELSLRRHSLRTRAVRLARRLDQIASILESCDARGDERLEQVQRLLARPGSQAPALRVLAFCSEKVTKCLSDAQAPLEGAELEVARSAQEVRELLGDPTRRPDLIILDPALWSEESDAARGPEASPFGSVRSLAACSTLVALGRQAGGPAAQVLVATEDESLGPAKTAFAVGVTDYLLLRQTEPGRLRERVQQVLHRLGLHRRDRAIIMDLLNVDIDRLESPAPPKEPGAEDFAAFEPELAVSVVDE